MRQKNKIKKKTGIKCTKQSQSGCGNNVADWNAAVKARIRSHGMNALKSSSTIF